MQYSHWKARRCEQLISGLVFLSLAMAAANIWCGEAASAIEINYPELCSSLVKEDQRPVKPPCSFRPARSCGLRTPVIAATYHYFYSPESRRDGMTHYPPSYDDFSGAKKSWHRRQLREMLHAGIDFALVDFALPPPGERFGNAGSSPGPWMFGGLEKLVEARHSLMCDRGEAPALGLHLNTWALDADGNDWTQNGVNLREESGRDFLYRNIATFFCWVMPQNWALIDDRAVVFLGSFRHAGAVDTLLFDYLQARFQADFGIGLYIVKEREDLQSIAKIDPGALRLATQLAREELTLEDIHAQILGSDEFHFLSGGTDAAFLKQLYIKLNLQAEATASEPLIPSREERRKFVASLFAGPLRAKIHAAWAAHWYKLYLEREEPMADLINSLPADDLMRGWVGALDRGVHYDAPRSEILASTKCFAKAGRAPEVFLRRLYETVYFRCPAADELKLWEVLFKKPLGQIDSREFDVEQRKAVAARFLAHPEAKRLDVALLYAHYLDRLPGWPGFSEKTFSETGAVCPEFSGGVASIGPGYDNSGWARSEALVVDRRHGGYYQAAWHKILSMSPRPDLVYLQSWNNFYEATELVRSREFGSRFMALTREFAEQFKRAENLLEQCP